jgi:hypothetical protein
MVFNSRSPEQSARGSELRVLFASMGWSQESEPWVMSDVKRIIKSTAPLASSIHWLSVIQNTVLGTLWGGRRMAGKVNILCKCAQRGSTHQEEVFLSLSFLPWEEWDLSGHSLSHSLLPLQQDQLKTPHGQKLSLFTVFPGLGAPI